MSLNSLVSMEAEQSEQKLLQREEIRKKCYLDKSSWVDFILVGNYVIYECRQLFKLIVILNLIIVSTVKNKFLGQALPETS